MNPTTVFNLRGSYSKIVDSFEAENARIEPKTLQELWPNNPWYEPYQTELPALYYPGLTVVSETNSLLGVKASGIRSRPRGTCSRRSRSRWAATT